MAVLVLCVLRADRRADRESGPEAGRGLCVLGRLRPWCAGGPAVDGAVRPTRLGSPRGATPESGRALCALQGQ